MPSRCPEHLTIPDSRPPRSLRIIAVPSAMSVAVHNSRAANHGFRKGHNQFSDITDAEFERRVHVDLSTKPAVGIASPLDLHGSMNTVPTSKDWDAD
eukprot:gene12739-biopygen6365